MRYAIALMLLCTVTAFIRNPQSSLVSRQQTVNALLGDVSFQKKFGHLPEASTDEDLRIATHLEYVENLLRTNQPTTLSATLRRNREVMIDLLHDYRTAGVFPKNYDYEDQRRPCFIDRDGKICAVGYLVAGSAGREAAEQINRAEKYSYISQMKNPDVENWIAESGLTKEECAMIQPSYGFQPIEQDSISFAYGVGSALLGGINVSLNAVNGIQILQGAHGKIVPIVGMVTGAGQITLGILNLSTDHLDENSNYVQAGDWKNALSYINIGIGTTTLFLSTWNLLDGKSSSDNRSDLNWNLHTIPTPNDGIGIGLTVNGQF